MAYDEIEASRAFVKDSADNLNKYFDGLDNIRYLYSYEQLYEKARRNILTWTDAREYFRFDGRQELFWESHRSYSHFVLLSHAVVEYLSTRMLLQYFNPKRGHEEMFSAFEEIGQFNRQEMMYDLGIISGTLYNDMNQVRGVRNDFAHEVSPHFELEYDDHPLSILDDVREVTSRLVELLYGESYEQIIEILENVYSGTFPDDYSSVSTAELIDIYQFETEDGGGLYDQRLPRELHKRDIDPEAAPSFEEFESVNYLDDVGTGWADSQGFAVVQLRAIPFVPDAVYIEEEVPIHIHIEFISDSTMYEMFDGAPTEFEWYSYLMIDDRVVAIEPTDSAGCPDSRSDKIDERIPIEFECVFNNAGEHDITIGIQIINRPLRFHLVLFETQTKACGPFAS